MMMKKELIYVLLFVQSVVYVELFERYNNNEQFVWSGPLIMKMENRFYLLIYYIIDIHLIVYLNKIF